ncbi:MAG TPA: YeeE/YedE family protein [Burkholderiaceae bacterium]
MNLDWPNFTPWSALAGGVLIGVATVLFFSFNGRIAGISGILGGLLRPAKGDIAWRIAFLGGLIGAPLLYGAFYGMPNVTVAAGPATLIAAGLLVGAGTRYGSGCTSGHGVCGVSRLSPRSLMATVVFMLAGFATVYAVRHLI